MYIFDWQGYEDEKEYWQKQFNIQRLQSQEDLQNLIEPNYFKEFPEVFRKQEFDKLPERCPWDHAIELIPGFKPTDCKIYPLSIIENQALDQFLDENLKIGHIRPSKSPMASPFFFVKKKSGELRSVQDYRKLNSMTIKNKYPLPLIPELIDKLKDSTCFTKLNV